MMGRREQTGAAKQATVAGIVECRASVRYGAACAAARNPPQQAGRPQWANGRCSTTTGVQVA